MDGCSGQLFDVVMMVDYSARQTRGRPAGEVNGIWLATGGPGSERNIRPFRTRLELQDHLVEALTAHMSGGRRVLLGLDFCFGFPAGTAAALGGPSPSVGGREPWSWMWSELGRRITDDPSGTNNRFAVAAELNRRAGDDGPFWGRPQTQQHDGLHTTKPAFPHRATEGPDLAEFRLTERTLHWTGSAPKSVWQLYGAGSVGGQSLVGIAMVERLRRTAAALGWARDVVVWPFEDSKEAHVVVAEVYPSLVAEAGPTTMIRDARQVLGLVEWFTGQDRAGHLGRHLCEPLDLDSAVRSEEGWILGVPTSVGT